MVPTEIRLYATIRRRVETVWVNDVTAVPNGSRDPIGEWEQYTHHSK